MNKKIRSNFKIGYACKFYDYDNSYNFKTVKVKTIDNFQKYSEKVEKISEILIHNINALKKQINEMLQKWPENLWMLRIGSDIFPLYTHPLYKEIYRENQIREILDSLKDVGYLIKKNNIRISMHPGHFTMLVSKDQKIMENSIEDLEYHADVFRFLGVDCFDQKNEINIHVGVKTKNFEEILINNFNKLSFELKQWLSIENDEFSYCVSDLIKFFDKIKIVLDVHHYWIKNGKYIQCDDKNIEKIIFSWRGAVPEIHYSLPREDFLKEEYRKILLENEFNIINEDVTPDIFVEVNRKKLRSHSNYCWSKKLNEYIINFLNYFDIMVEAKAKQKASRQLFEFVNRQEKDNNCFSHSLNHMN